jgi:hypothetical protein
MEIMRSSSSRIAQIHVTYFYFQNRFALLLHPKSDENFQVISGEEGSELIGCQLLSDETNQNHILADGCMFSKGEFLKISNVTNIISNPNHNSISESPFNCDVLFRQFSLPCENLSFCDVNTAQSKSTTTVHTTKQNTKEKNPATTSQTVEYSVTIVDPEPELTTANNSEVEKCTCQTDSVRVIVCKMLKKLLIMDKFQLPIDSGFLWAMVCLNLVIIAVVTLWWWSILKNNNYSHIEEERHCD